MNINRPKTPRGFTMMELLVVISIIVVLAGLTLGGMNYVNQKQAREKAKVQIGLLQMALEEYKSDNGEFPRGRNRTGENGTGELIKELAPTGSKKVYLPELIEEQAGGQGWLLGGEIVDPWGNEYRYRVDHGVNPDFDLWSVGPDGTSRVTSQEYDPKHEDNVDDIRGW